MARLDSKGRSKREWIEAFLMISSLEEVKDLLQDLNRLRDDPDKVDNMLADFKEGVRLLMMQGKTEKEACRTAAKMVAGTKLPGFVWKK